MKLPLLMMFLLLVSCADEKQENAEVEETEESKEISINEKITDFDLEVVDFDGLKKYLETSDIEKTYVLNFWATWCAPCIKELPYFEKLNTEYKDKNIEVILVSLDFPSKYDSHLKPFIFENNLKSKIVALDDVDSNTWIPAISENWSGAIPATLIFNSRERKFYEGSFNYDELITALKPFIN